MDDATLQRLESSFGLLAPRGEELVERFYARLFSTHPAVRPMFPDSLVEQKKKLLASIVLVMQNIRQPDALAEPLKQMGARHVAYGTQPEQYGVVRDTLVAVMAEMAGEAWTLQLTEDWTGALNFVASVMLEGAEGVEQSRQAA